MSHYVQRRTLAERNEAEIRRLTNELSRANNRVRDLNNRLYQTERNNRSLTDRINEADRRIQHLNEETAEANEQARQLRTQLAEQYRQTQAEMQTLEENHARDLRDLSEAITAEMGRRERDIRAAVSRTREELETQIAEANRNIEVHGRRIQDVENRLEQTARSNAELLDRARIYYENAQMLSAQTRGFRTDLVSADLLRREEDSLSSASADIAEAGTAETLSPAACSSARAAYTAAFSTHQAVLVAEQEWISHLGVAEQTAEYLERVLTQSSFINNETYEDLDVNYWSFGRLDELRERLAQIRMRIVSANDDRLSLAQVDGLTAALAQIQSDLQERVLPAALINYERARDMDNYADQVIHAFHDCAMLNLQADAYHYDEDREAYMMHFRNANGLELSIELRPVPDTGGYDVIYHVLSQGNQLNYEVLQDTLHNILGEIGVEYQCERGADGSPRNYAPDRPCTSSDEQTYRQEASRINTTWKQPRPMSPAPTPRSHDQ